MRTHWINELHVHADHCICCNSNLRRRKIEAQLETVKILPVKRPLDSCILVLQHSFYFLFVYLSVTTWKAIAVDGWFVKYFVWCVICGKFLPIPCKECTDYRGTQQLPQYIQMYSAWIANTWFREFLSGMSFMLYHKIILNKPKNVWCGDSFTTSRLANGESITCPPV